MPLVAVFVVLVAAAALARGSGEHDARADRPHQREHAGGSSTAHVAADHPASALPRRPYRPGPPVLPPGHGHGPSASHVFADGRVLVAYYGTAGTGSLGVLGETPPEQMQHRLARAAAPFARGGRPVQLVYELIVSIADRSPGPDGDYSHDLARAEVRRYLAAAHRHHALLLLDVQPGRGDFVSAARRWGWALRDPSVGLALDPEWRMHGRDVPGRSVGWVDAAEVNRTSLWLNALQRRYRLPEKLLVLHQFRTDMVRGIGTIRPRPGLAEVQHVDGFGTPGQKLATYHSVARPQKFFLGFKLFYDEDAHRLSAAAVDRIRPGVRFVSFQ